VLLTGKPLFTEEHDLSGDWLASASTYIYAVTTEDRSEQALALGNKRPDVDFVELHEPDSDAFESNLSGHEYVRNRDADGVAAFLAALRDGPVVIDITGFTHNTWVPLIKMAVKARRDLTVVYFEPNLYALSSNPRLGEFYDLSEKTSGIGPLPLMVNLEETNEDSVVYIPLLGFEGQRSLFMFEQMNTDARRMYPVVGLPGFKLDYPFEALLGNHQLLIETKSHRDIRFAKSNCPFSLFYVLDRIRERHVTSLMRVGLTGTKPHALGAVLFALARGSNVELVYDHVKRKAKRTEGADRCVVYRVARFMGGQNAS
jgi:hypothetical protein